MKCHKTIKTEQLAPGQTRYIMCNRDQGHRGKCSVKGEKPKPYVPIADRA